MTVEEYHSPVRFFFLVDIWFTQAVIHQEKRGLLSALLIAEHLVRYPMAAEL